MTTVKLNKDDTVKNVIGSSCASSCESAIGYWRKQAKLKKSPDVCCIKGCKEKAVHGSHVKLGYLNVNSYYWFIVCTCQKHNKGCSNERFYVKQNTIAVKENRISAIDHINSILCNIRHQKI